MPLECKDCCSNRSISTCENLRHIMKRYETPLDDIAKNVRASILKNEPLNLNSNRKTFKINIGNPNLSTNLIKKSNCTESLKDENLYFQKDKSQ